jgi:3-hydroxybutyrate dehydrogenase
MSEATLAGRTALITDGTGAIGAAAARALARRGASLLLHDITASERTGALCAELRSATTGQVAARDADLTRIDDVDTLFDAAAALGPVDVLVHLACPQHISPVERFPLEQWNGIFAAGVVAAFRLTQRALPAMRERRWGRIVLMSSVQGLVASVDKSGYVAAKHALVGFAKAVALETAGSGVTCNAICPGWTGTESTRAQAAIKAKALGVSLDDGLKLLLEEKQPSRQWVAVDAIGELVAFLCSDAAAQMTGAAIPIDGGWVAQ